MRRGGEGKLAFFYLKIMEKICFEPRKLQSPLFQEISGKNGISRVIEQ